MERAVDCPTSNSWLNSSCLVLSLSLRLAALPSRSCGLTERAGSRAQPGCSMHERAVGPAPRDAGGRTPGRRRGHGFVREADGVLQPEEVENGAALRAAGLAEWELLL